MGSAVENWPEHPGIPSRLSEEPQVPNAHLPKAIHLPSTLFPATSWGPEASRGDPAGRPGPPEPGVRVEGGEAR